jgi:hypothetical protein
MHPLRLTLKNYRCFADEAPLTIELREGFTALVGPNNSGKSTVLRFVHEMRQLWKYLAGSGSPLVEAFRGNSFGINYRDVVDPEELFCNANARDLTFAIELLEVKQEIASEMTLPILGVMGRAARQEPNLWQITLLDGHQPSLLAHTIQPIARGSIRVRSDSLLSGMAGNLISRHSRKRQRIYLPVFSFRRSGTQSTRVLASTMGWTVGSSFVDQWRNWKTGLVKVQARAIEQVTEDIRSVFEFDSLEINASDQHKTLAISIDRLPID